ncbi:hypothetical protein [Streptomyces sp. NPDC052036]|uniref:hypothetical protein n=1 Tax=Streptomyces sp. NPDC052036 TaxID=3155171 RepID=UPI0034439AC1
MVITAPSLVSLAGQVAACDGFWFGLAVLGLDCLPRLALALTHVLTAMVACATEAAAVSRGPDNPPPTPTHAATKIRPGTAP